MSDRRPQLKNLYWISRTRFCHLSFNNAHTPYFYTNTLRIILNGIGLYSLKQIVKIVESIPQADWVY